MPSGQNAQGKTIAWICAQTADPRRTHLLHDSISHLACKRACAYEMIQALLITICHMCNGLHTACDICRLNGLVCLLRILGLRSAYAPTKARGLTEKGSAMHGQIGGTRGLLCMDLPSMSRVGECIHHYCLEGESGSDDVMQLLTSESDGRSALPRPTACGQDKQMAMQTGERTVVCMKTRPHSVLFPWDITSAQQGGREH